MKQDKEVYADVVSGISVHNGMVRIYFVGQDHEYAASRNMQDVPVSDVEGEGQSDVRPMLKQTVIMPLAGFASLVQTVAELAQNEKFGEQLKRLSDAGFMPQPDKAIKPDKAIN